MAKAWSRNGAVVSNWDGGQPKSRLVILPVSKVLGRRNPVFVTIAKMMLQI